MMILGLVQWMQPVHGYDVRRELLSWSADKWANVQPGSIYHALRKLAEEELLREVATEQVGARPARTTYEITDEGRRRVRVAAARQLVERSATPPDPFMAAFSFLPALPRAEAAAALRNRAIAAARPASSSCRRRIERGLGATTSRSTCAGCGSWRSTAPRRRSRWCERIAELIEQASRTCRRPRRARACRVGRSLINQV